LQQNLQTYHKDTKKLSITYQRNDKITSRFNVILCLTEILTIKFVNSSAFI